MRSITPNNNKIKSITVLADQKEISYLRSYISHHPDLLPHISMSELTQKENLLDGNHQVNDMMVFPKCFSGMFGYIPVSDLAFVTHTNKVFDVAIMSSHLLDAVSVKMNGYLILLGGDGNMEGYEVMMKFEKGMIIYRKQ
jgi:hypothetical protein